MNVAFRHYLLLLADAKCDGAGASTSWFSFTNEVVLAGPRISVARSVVPKPGGIDQFEAILNIRCSSRRLVLITSPVSPTGVGHWASIHVVEIALIKYVISAKVGMPCATIG